MRNIFEKLINSRKNIFTPIKEVSLKFISSLSRFFLISLIFVFILIFVLVIISYNLPSIEGLQNYKPIQIAKIISADGKPIKELYIEQRDIVEIAKVPKDLRNALVFMEDRKFFEHPGIDIWGIIRAITVNFTGGRTQGASTITQQLARNMYDNIGFEKSILRKVKEFITAVKIEQTYTKSEIMELYLNSVFFGHRAYGIQQASKFYFGKDISDLNLNECATLVGILPAPNRYSPKKNIDTVIGHSNNFYQKYSDSYIENSEKIILTKIDGELYKDKKIILSDMLFLNNTHDTIPMIFLNNDVLGKNMLSAKYDYQENKLLVYLKTDQKINYFRFKVLGMKNMKINGIGGGVADSLGFIEINNSSRSIKRKDLVLKILKDQKYINSNQSYLSSLSPLIVSQSDKKKFETASYFSEDVRLQLLGYQQSMSYDKIEFLLPEFPLRKKIIKDWLKKNYKMMLDINGNQFDLFKDGLRVHTTLDTRIQKFLSDIFKDEMEKNQFDLYKIYNENSRLLDTVILISKDRKYKELKKHYKFYSNSIKQNIIKKEIEIWKNLNKNEFEINEIILEGQSKGEKFTDSNNNGKYDLSENFIDGNGQYNQGERFTDSNNNEVYDSGEIFIDKKNKRYDPDGIIVKKLKIEIEKNIQDSMNSLNYDNNYILSILKDKKDIPSYLRKEFLVQGSAVVLDVNSGNIVAMIGGRQEEDYIDFFNRSSKAVRQPGSIFKPFIYMTSLKNYNNEHIPFTTNYKIYNQPLNIPIDDITSYNPQNHDMSTGGLTTLREGLKRSLNLISVRLISEIEEGPKKVRDKALKFGFSTPIYPGEALALGTSDVIPLEMTSAYSAIANNGVLIKPKYIGRIENSLGKVLDTPQLDQEFAEKDEALIFIIRDMMKDVIDSGTGSSLRWKYKFNSPVAGKTGTTNKFTDAWFVGFTPQLAIGIWVGMDNPAVSIHKFGSQAALPIFAKSIKKIYDFGEFSLGNDEVRKLDKNLDWAERQEGVIKKKLCKKSMKLPNKYCKNKDGLVDELFLEDFIPNDICDIKTHSSRYK